MSRLILRSILELRPALPRSIPPSRPAAALRTISSTRRASATATTTPTTTTTTTVEPSSTTTSTAVPTKPSQLAALNYPPQPLLHKPLSDSVRTLLPHLAAAPRHYATVHVHGLAYMVTLGDHVRLPFRMKNVVPGDVIRLTRASVVGSRDLTLKGSPFIDERLFDCRATILGVESEPLRVKIKKKRRCRKKRRVRSKHRYTIISVSGLRVRGLEEVEGL